MCVDTDLALTPRRSGKLLGIQHLSDNDSLPYHFWLEEVISTCSSDGLRKRLVKIPAAPAFGYPGAPLMKSPNWAQCATQKTPKRAFGSASGSPSTCRRTIASRSWVDGKNNSGQKSFLVGFDYHGYLQSSL
jgi:hypothetical protein